MRVKLTNRLQRVLLDNDITSFLPRGTVILSLCQVKGRGGGYLQHLGALSGITHLGEVDVHLIGLTWERAGDHDHHAGITTLHSGRSLLAFPEPLPKFKFPRAT